MFARLFLVLAALFCAAPLTADATVNFWNRTVWKLAQSYPLDTNVYTGWGPDWQNAGAFHQMSLAFETPNFGFLLDSQFNASADFQPHINAAQAWAALVPKLARATVGKLKLDDYRITTPFMDKGMGRIQMPDDWLAASVTVATAGFSSTLVVPSYAGSASSLNVNASASGPNTPTQQRLGDAWSYLDWLAAYEIPRTGLRLVAGVFGDTMGGLAYGSTGTDLPSTVGTIDPKRILRAYYGGATYTGSGLSGQVAITSWGVPEISSATETNLRAIAGLKGTVGAFQWGLEGLVDYRSAVASASATTTQVVRGFTSTAYTIQQGPLTGLGFATLATNLKALTSIDAVAALAIGGGTQDLFQGNGLGSYSLPLYDAFLELYPSLTFAPANLKVGFDYKYDFSAGLATWLVPITLTVASS